MNEKEWREGMENEAASVSDAAWARETRMVAAQAKPNRLWLDVFLSAIAIVLIPLAFWSYWTAMVNCRFNIRATALNCWAIQNSWSIDGLAVLLLFSVPFVLGLLRVRSAGVLLAFALIPVVNRLWPAVMPLLDLQPKLESVGLPSLNMQTQVRFDWIMVAQIVLCPPLAWLSWSKGRKLRAKKGRT